MYGDLHKKEKKNVEFQGFFYRNLSAETNGNANILVVSVNDRLYFTRFR